MTSTALAFTTAAAFLLPILFVILVSSKKGSLFSSIIFGALCFFVFQVLTRIPLLQLVLPKMDWFILFQSTQPLLYILFLSVTAALFEELGRFLVMRFLMKERRGIDDALAFGLGHGGIEAVILVGLPTLMALLAQDPAVLSQLSPSEAFAGGIERILTMAIHIGLSVMVMQSVRKGNLLWLLLAFSMHTLVNFISVYALNVMGLNIWLAELIVAVFAASLGYYAIFEYKRAKAEG